MHQLFAQVACAVEVADVDLEKSFERVKRSDGLRSVLVVEVEMIMQ